ncbi:MAG: hypothetical protein VB099_09935 [Candidatus Limiplasma sp.]|nr:hypothetical protein [Candidatus Limiplasma sp.]
MKLMKRMISILCAVLTLAAVPALAEGTAEINLTRYVVGKDVTYAPEGYDTVWVTPVFDDHIITQTNPEKYPAKFITFAAPEKAGLVRYSYDESTLLDLDALVAYYYIAFDRASFELFLGNVPEENILADGSDGVAMYTKPDNMLAYALLDISDSFGETSKLQIGVQGFARSATIEQVTELFEQEVQRVRDSMTVQEPGQFWSEGRFGTVQLGADRDPFTAQVSVSGLTVTRIESHRLITKTADGRSALATEIAIDTYAYPYQKEEAEDAALADGTPYKRYISDYSGHAAFVLSEEGKYGPLYLTFKIDGTPDAFEQQLEQAYARVTVEAAQ